LCGVELEGNEHVIFLFLIKEDMCVIPDCGVRKKTLKKSHSLKFFQSTFAKLMADYKIETVIIRERPTAGKFSGGAVGFKLEAAIQLIDGLKVELITPTDIKAYIKRNPIPVSFEDTGLKVFQEGAFTTAYAYLMHSHYADPNDS